MLFRRQIPKTIAPFIERDEIDPRIIYKVNPRSKRISIKIDEAKREVIVNAPSTHHIPAAKRFAREKADWIDVHLEKIPPAMPFTRGGYILYRGQMTQILSPNSREQAKFIPAREDENGTLHPQRLLIPAPPDALPGRAMRFLKKQAREALEARTDYHRRALDLRPTKISVRDTRSRWGSCAADGNINYSWRLICAPPFVLDYVCAHEVAHRLEMNHSRAFWDIVDELVDTTKPAKKWLRENGARLHAVGAEY